MRVSIIIPNYNGKNSLAKNLPRVLTCGADEVIVVDDASTDGSVEFLKKNFSKVKVITKEKNEGFSSTVNLGVEKAQGEIIVLLNQDVQPHENFLKFLTSHFQNENVFGVGCLDESPENGKIVLRGRGVGEFKKGFLVHSRGEVDKTDTLWVSGGSGAFRKELWKKLGGFDSLYDPYYWEDIDLSYRAQKAGFRILFEQKSKVIHQHGESIIEKSFSSFKIKTLAYRNQFFFVWKNITDPPLLARHFLWLPYHLLRALFSLDFAFWLGFFLALGKLPWIILSRQRTIELFTKTDREILGQF